MGLFCTFGLHDWEVVGNRRRCKACGIMQEYDGTIDDPDYWMTIRDTSICITCNGDRAVFDDRGRRVPCPDCGGTGKQ